MRSCLYRLFQLHIRHHASNNLTLARPLVLNFQSFRCNSSQQTPLKTEEAKNVSEEPSSGSGSVPKVQQEESSLPQHLEGIELDSETAARIKYHEQKRRVRKEVLRMDPADYEGTAVGLKRSYDSLLEAREGDHGPSVFKHLRFKKDHPEMNQTDQLNLLHADIDLRWESLKRWWAKLGDDAEIRLQEYNAKRNAVLGNDLAAAHFIVFRKGKVKFLGKEKWITEYRTDAEVGKDELDLPAMQFDLCALPTTYDPSYLVEAIEITEFPIRYEGLENLKGLRYLKSLRLNNCHHVEAWCMDLLADYFGERLLHLDLSSCHGLTEGALCAVARFRKLKTLVVHDLPQISNMAVVCAILEDRNPDLKIIGVDYAKKLEEVVKENERLDKEARELEESTITVEPKFGPGPDPIQMHSEPDPIVQAAK